MSESASGNTPDLEREETQDWLLSLEDVLRLRGPDRVRSLLRDLQIYAQKEGVELPMTSVTPYVNSIAVDQQPPYPGHRELERRIKSLIRWNAMAMVVRANRDTNVGGHIASFASSAALYDVGFNWFWRDR
jgi:pyruvate dehydrogenase E1 component